MIVNTNTQGQGCPICDTSYVDDYFIHVPGFSTPQPGSRCKHCGYTVFIPRVDVEKIEAKLTEVMRFGKPTGCFSCKG